MNINVNKEIDKNYAYFLKYRNRFLEIYNGKYILIHNKEVVDSFDDFYEAYSKAKNKYDTGTFIIQDCTNTPLIISRLG